MVFYTNRRDHDFVFFLNVTGTQPAYMIVHFNTHKWIYYGFNRLQTWPGLTGRMRQTNQISVRLTVILWKFQVEKRI